MMLPTLMYSPFSPVPQNDVLHLDNEIYTQPDAVDAMSVPVGTLTRFSLAPDVHKLIRVAVDEGQRSIRS